MTINQTGEGCRGMTGGLICAGLVWLSAIFGGTWWMMDYANRGGRLVEPAMNWPEALERDGESSVLRTVGYSQLMLFLHPHCGCSRASLAEFEKLTKGAERTEVSVVFTIPEGASAGWELGVLWDRVAEMEGVKVRLDKGGWEAGRFGVSTSGTVVMYDALGRLSYRGGVTISRGHSGESPGGRRLQDLLSGTGGRGNQGADDVNGCVFGCSLF